MGVSVVSLLLSCSGAIMQLIIHLKGKLFTMSSLCYLILLDLHKSPSEVPYRMSATTRLNGYECGDSINTLVRSSYAGLL